MHSMLLRSMALRTKQHTKPILLYKSDFNETCLSDLEFKYTSQLRYCRAQIDSGASSVSDGDSRQRTLPICSPRRTTNLPRTYVAQILKRLKECLHQQKIVEILLSGISGNTELISFWTFVSRSLTHHPTFTGNRTQSFVPMSVKEEEIPPRLPGPTPSLLSFCGFM